LEITKTGTGPSYVNRWAESRAYSKLCAASLREHDYATAINWLHEAHNLGRDNIILHAATHLRYVQFSLHEGCYKRALGHVFWALSSPLFVPLGRARRTAIVGEWNPAPPIQADVEAAPKVGLKASVAPSGLAVGPESETVPPSSPEGLTT
jgi:hypothetical protein